MVDKKVAELIRQARIWPGWRVADTKSGWLLYPPDPSLSPVAVHSTPSDRRAYANTVARLRQRGAPI